MLDILSIEYGLKSSGMDMGKPSTMLRLNGCNLHCRGCRKMWDKSSQMENQEIVDNISILGCKNLVITGGEPLCQRMQLVDLLRLLDEYRVTIESNGTLSARLIEDFVDIWDITLKLESSGQRKTYREKSRTIKDFALMKNAYFCFEIRKHNDMYEVSQLQKRYGFDTNNMMLIVYDLLLKDMVYEFAKNKGISFQIPLEFQIR